jgi:hypothetical protein
MKPLTGYYAPRPAERSEAGRGAFLFWDNLMINAHIGSGKWKGF